MSRETCTALIASLLAIAVTVLTVWTAVTFHAHDQPQRPCHYTHGDCLP